MSILRYDDAYLVGATGTTVTTGATSARVAIPNNAAGTKARFIRLSATGACYVKIGDSSVTATTNDVLLMGQYPEVYQSSGTHIAYLQQSAAQTLNIIPLET